MYNWQNKTFLLVDDDKDFCYILSLILKKTGANLVITNSGDEALAYYNGIAGSGKIDLIILDIQMAHMSGYDFIGIIRNMDARIPVLALTAYGISGERQRCLSLGFQEYLAKPFEESRLLDLIQKLLN